jgi:hypothetical protein
VSVNQQQVQVQVSDQQLRELRERLEAARQLRRAVITSTRSQRELELPMKRNGLGIHWASFTLRDAID